MTQPEGSAETLMAFLQRLKKMDDRAKLADLRCGFSEAKAPKIGIRVF